MGLSPLLPIAGATLGSLTGKALDTIARGPSFLEVLQGSIGLSQSVANDKKTAAQDALSAEELTENLDAFVHRLKRSLAAAQADTSLAIEIKSDGRDGVILDNPHPDRATIERLLSSDSELRAEFHRLATEVAAARARHAPFASHDITDFRLRLDEAGAQVRLI